MKYVSGEILTPDGFIKGHLSYHKNVIVDINNGVPPEKPIAKGVIVPLLVNAHTHIGDSFINSTKVYLPRDVEKLVAPPHGIKHKFLQNATEKEIVEGMKKSIDIMQKSGVGSFCDFREGGLTGVTQLNSAMQNTKITGVVLSRPQSLAYNKDELDILLNNSEGIGLSSVSDWEYSEIQKIAKHTKKKNKIFALHCSEIIREDIDLVLDLKPDFLVHMVKATESDLLRVKENNVSIVICPRSNIYFGLKPNIKKIKKIQVDVMFGTDNAMINQPDILNEIKFVCNNFNEFTIKELLYMITYTTRKALNLDHGILGPDSPSNFIVLNENSMEIKYISPQK